MSFVHPPFYIFVAVENLLWWTSIFLGIWLKWVSGHPILRTGSYMKVVLYRKCRKFPMGLKIYTSMYIGDFIYNFLLFTIMILLIYCCAIRTVWEIKQRTLVDMAVDRGCYIDQSQSLNIHMDQPNFGKLTSLHFHAWSRVCYML